MKNQHDKILSIIPCQELISFASFSVCFGLELIL